jgi:LmbE family N-acetylglucosaminyl deacetylase
LLIAKINKYKKGGQSWQIYATIISLTLPQSSPLAHILMILNWAVVALWRKKSVRAIASAHRAIVLSGGRRGVLTEADRAKETTKAFANIGIDDVVVYDLEDTKLSNKLNEIVQVLESQVREFRPVRIYTMFQHDRHQDHRTVYEASIIACRCVPQLLGYETPSSYPNFLPTVFEDISDFLEQKVTALNCHISQGSRLYMQQEKIRAAAHFRGAQVDLGPSEGFIPYKFVI